MRLEYLHYLLIIDAHHSISAAARELYISQNALSSILSRVEEELGFPVFIRSHNGVTPTEDGKEVLSIAWEIWSHHQAVLNINHQVEKSSASVNLVSSPSIHCGLTVPLIRAFRREEPLGHLIFQESTGSDIENRILQNRANIGLTYLNQKSLAEVSAASHKQQIKIDCLLRDRLFLIVREDSPLTEQDAVSLEDIQSRCVSILPQLLTENPTFYSNLLKANNYFTIFPSVPHIKQAVLDLDSYGILCGFAYTQDKSVDCTRLRAIPFLRQNEEEELFLCLIHHKLSSLHHQEQVLLRCIRDFFYSLSDDFPEL